MKHKGGRDREQRQRPRGCRKLPADQQRRARAQFQHNDQRQQHAWNMVRGHMVQERLRPGDLCRARQNEQQRQKGAADNRDDSDGHGVLLCWFRELQLPVDIQKSIAIYEAEQNPMPRLNREESQARTRNLLIEAARDEIVKKGFAQASVRDIADAAGVSQGAFYSNFSDKEAILLELVQRHQSEERAQIEAPFSHAPGDAAGAVAGVAQWG